MASRQWGMCVKHLNRCKTSTFELSFLVFVCIFQVISNKGTSTFGLTFLVFVCIISNDFKQGATAPFISPWPTKLLMFGEDTQSDQLHVPALFHFHFTVNGNRPSPEPASRIIGRPRFGFDGKVASSKDVEWILSHCFSPLVTNHFLSGLTEVFLHVRCIPHQNSQGCF